VIRTEENLTRRPSPIRPAGGCKRELAEGRGFRQVMIDGHGPRFERVAGDCADIPAEGPLVMASNHPCGMPGAPMLWRFPARSRPDVRILAHQECRTAAELVWAILPTSFDGSREAREANLGMRRLALDHLAAGGATGVFPGGTSSTAPRPFGRPMSPPRWRITARLIRTSGAAVVPVHFVGANRLPFRVASPMREAQRLALLAGEFWTRIGAPVRVAIGRPVAPEALAAHAGGVRAMAQCPRAETCRPSAEPTADRACGVEFEELH